MVPLQPRRVIGGQRERGGVRLAETEAGEGPQHLPHLLHGLQVVPLLQRCRDEPGPDLDLTVRGPQLTAHLIGLGQRTPAHDRDQTQNLFVEDDHPMGLPQGRLEIRVETQRFPPPVPGGQEGSDHVALHRAGPEQRDVDDEVVEVARPELTDQFPLTGRFDLETAEGLGLRDQVVGVLIVEGQRVEIDLGPLHPADLGHRMGHRRLHADAEYVEFEETHRLDLVLVELAHREAHPTGLHRGAVE